MSYRIFIFLLLILVVSGCKKNQTPSDDGPMINENLSEFWIDPAIDANSDQSIRIIAWFDTQLIDFDESYIEKTASYTEGRSALRSRLVSELKDLNSGSIASAQSALDALIQEEIISDFEPLWIVNGFTAIINEQSINELARIPGLHSVFENVINSIEWVENGPREAVPNSDLFTYDPNLHETVWHIDSLNVPRVWTELGFTGLGTKHVVHDGGFTLDVEVISRALYRNPEETPGNGIDDDNNGYIDDIHGYNFESDNGYINVGLANNAGILHGNTVAGIIAGGSIDNTQFGIAPNAKWAGVVGFSTFTEGVQWAVEQGFDTYNMSFSLPNLKDLRGHWRKVSEHAALSGLVLISGAGNFGNPSSANFAEIPVQLRTPEDIPETVFGVGGVRFDGVFPAFSSKGPVEWNTEHYKDGQINKPDFSAFNIGIETFDDRGRSGRSGNGNSYSAPQLAGIIALMLEANPDLRVWEIKRILENTARDILEPGVDDKTGAGQIDAYAAVLEAMN